MTGRTTIEWTHLPGFVGASWNPTVGCTRVSAGCDNCYAFELHDRRYAGNLRVAERHVEGTKAQLCRDLESGKLRRMYAGLVGKKQGLSVAPQYDLPFSRVQLLEDRLDVPLRTRKPTCYFVDSMADLFHEDVPDEYIDKVWHTMAVAKQHRFLVLTKHPERMAVWVTRNVIGVAPQIWLGTSVEDQRSADERIPHLLATPAAVRFLSCEPLLGPIDLCGYLERVVYTKGDSGRRGLVWTDGGIQWVILGGESGPHARPMNLAWARSLVAQCRAAGVPVFVKQLGARPYERMETSMPGYAYSGGDLSPAMLRPPHEAQRHGWTSVTTALETFLTRCHRLSDRKGGDPTEWPEDLRVRGWPDGR